MVAGGDKADLICGVALLTGFRLIPNEDCNGMSELAQNNIAFRSRMAFIFRSFGD